MSAGEQSQAESSSPLSQALARGRFRGRLALLGPAFVAAIAYVDPGNFATNVAGGASYGYLLVWVIVLANLLAALIQNLSAKLGLATGKNLAELCREELPRPLVWLLWAQAELVAMATDLAEFVGAAIALNLLFGVPLFPAGLITAGVAFAILSLQRAGYRPFERVITGLLLLIAAGFLYQILQVDVDGGELARGLIPSFADQGSVLLAAGILGATVMPHVIYLHSALTQQRIPPRDLAEARRLLRFQRVDIGLAMAIAGLVNLSILLLAAGLFFGSGLTEVSSLEGAHRELARSAGAGVALAFAFALLISGLASSGVGTYAGQVIMQGFIRRSLPLFFRRALTMSPALLVLAVGVDPSRALVLSQVVLSFGIPFALIPLVWLSSRSSLMGGLVNRPLTTLVAGVAAGMISLLNLFLIYQVLTG